MTAIPLFDALARRQSETTGKADADAIPLAERLVEASLSDLRRIDDYEQEFGLPDFRSPSAAEIMSSVYRLYEQWAGEAEQILRRVRRLIAGGRSISSAAALEDAFGRVQARLGLTPEKIARGIEDARQGRTVPVQAIRDELRDRLRR
ncbi:MAG TPA: hypothetical protein VK797_00850 [Tepidisphaeraceae bacterium]|jgi:hypothetical protein|nr:hypothetical protein [Tepidisphaeraceae bacterium]